MRFFRKFQVRAFYDADAGGGSGTADPAGGTPAGT